MHFGLPVVPDEYRMYSGWSKGSEAKDAAPPLTPNSCQRLARSEEHTSELQSRLHLVCRLLLEKKKPPCRPEVLHLVCAAPTGNAVPPRAGICYRLRAPLLQPRTALRLERAQLSRL